MTDSVLWRYAIISQKVLLVSLKLRIQKEKELDWKYMVMGAIFSKILKLKKKLINSKANGSYERYLRLWDHFEGVTGVDIE